MPSQADVSRFRWLNFASVAVSLAVSPADGVTGDTPQIILSPFTVSKMSTTGFLIMLKAPTTAVAATAGAGGFSVTIWVRDPATLRWASFAAQSIAYDQLFKTYDVDCVEIFVQLTNVAVDGAIDIGFAEQ